MSSDNIQNTARELIELSRQIRLCRNCDLALSRTQAVPGEGNPGALLAFFGEAPGADEDALGRPFVGAAGKFLDTMLEDIGLRRQDVFISNTVRCRPPGNRDPLPEEIEACNPWLFAQLKIIRPKVVCTLGRFAMAALIDPSLQISKVHGSLIEKDNILYIPLFHPAFALHQQSSRDTLITDMRKVRSLLMERSLWKNS